MARSGYGKSPYLDLRESLSVIREIQERGGGELTLEALSDVLDNTVKSSSFRRKVLALKDFGLAADIKDGKKLTGVKLTSLGHDVLLPASEMDRQEKLRRAVLEVSLFADLYERLKGQQLPEVNYLENIVRRDLGVGEDDSREWAEAFLEAVRTADMVDSRGILLAHVRKSKESKEPSVSATPSRPEQSAGSRPPSAGVDRDLSLRVPIAAGGVIEVRIPEDATSGDVEIALSLLRAVREQRGGGSTDT